MDQFIREASYWFFIRTWCENGNIKPCWGIGFTENRQKQPRYELILKEEVWLRSFNPSWIYSVKMSSRTKLPYCRAAEHRCLIMKEFCGKKRCTKKKNTATKNLKSAEKQLRNLNLTQRSRTITWSLIKQQEAKIITRSWNGLKSCLNSRKQLKEE